MFLRVVCLSQALFIQLRTALFLLGSAKILENNPDMESTGLHFRHSYPETAKAQPNKQFLAIIESWFVSFDTENSTYGFFWN